MSITLERYKRFEAATKIDVAGDVVALVGPNEAGKSSILDAILSLDTSGQFTRQERTRDAEGRTAVRASYILDDADRAALAEIPGGEDVRWWTYEKVTRSDGTGRYFHLHLGPRRDLGRRHQLAASLREFAEAEQLTPRFGSVGNIVIADIYQRVLATLLSTDDSLSRDEIEEVRLFANTMFQFGDICAEPPPGSTDQYVSPTFCALLRELQEFDEDVDPHTRAGRILEERRPRSFLFTEEDRELRTTYELSEVVANTPRALANLMWLSGMDLRALARAIDEEDSGRRETLLERANRVLRDVFRESWGQSDLTVRLALRGAALEILVSIPGGGYNAMHERSAGLRTFVALRAFLARKNVDIPPILLIDEAEMHLHYDAQADLIDLFTEQTLAAKVLYSTHSAGCLPRDLGTGIRVVVPEPDAERSRVENSVWAGKKAGFTPLIYGMGATTFAFLPARFVVLGEGPSDAMLYPTLFREAIEEEKLIFQVAPGLATIAPGNLPELISEGGHVVFLTDGDQDGRRYRRALEENGVAVVSILGLDSVFGDQPCLEDLIDPTHYAAVVNELLLTFQRPKHSLTAFDLSGVGRVDIVKNWCRRRGLTLPDKVDVAQRLLDRKSSAARAGEDMKLLAQDRRDGMQRLYRRILELLGPIAR